MFPFVRSVCVSVDCVTFLHDDIIKWKHFPRYWPFVRGIHRSPVNSPHKGQWRGALMFTLICARINGWVNNREAGDLRRYRAHYDVIVMFPMQIYCVLLWAYSLHSLSSVWCIIRQFELIYCICISAVFCISKSILFYSKDTLMKTENATSLIVSEHLSKRYSTQCIFTGAVTEAYLNNGASALYLVILVQGFLKTDYKGAMTWFMNWMGALWLDKWYNRNVIVNFSTESHGKIQWVNFNMGKIFQMLFSNDSNYTIFHSLSV